MTRSDRSRDDTNIRRARLFWNGRSQAVRLPLEFRFEGDEVAIRREGEAVILEPVHRRTWPNGYWTWMDAHRDELELGEIPAMGGSLLDVSLDDE